ncbi:hypothetical protein HDU98_000126 [Podochytrium sp. JEL0797]|nr:hypothetical protein HDU98_000126 [Podochytrium sp. JEL0797]
MGMQKPAQMVQDSMMESMPAEAAATTAPAVDAAKQKEAGSGTATTSAMPTMMTMPAMGMTATNGDMAMPTSVMVPTGVLGVAKSGSASILASVGVCLIAFMVL